MREIEVKTGGRRTYATDIQDAQLEVLYPLQEFLSNLGAILISGCAITPNVGTPANWDIAAGFVAIRHADGFKVARFAADTNLVLPGYMTIDKTTQQGDYGAVGFEVTKDKSYTYDAIFTAGAPVANDDTELVIPDPGTAAVRMLSDGMATAGNTTKEEFMIAEPDVTGSLHITVNKAARLMYIKAVLNVSFPSSLFPDVGVTVITEADLQANAVIGKYMPQFDQSWMAYTPFVLGYVLAKALPVVYQVGVGIVVYGPENTVYDLECTGVVPID